MSEADDVKALRKTAFRRVALQEAIDPIGARRTALNLFGEHVPIPRERVVAILGEKDAAALDTIRSAIAKFNEASHD